jgi:LEA14-like dessication related protein
MKVYIPLLFFIVALSSCAEFQPLTVGGVESPKIKTFSKEGIEGDFSMKIRNPNKMSVTVFPSTFDAMVNDMSVGKVKLNKRVRIKANSDDVSTFHIKSDFSNIGLTELPQLLSLVAGKNASVYLKGNLRAGKWFYKKKFPIELKKSISLSQ